MTRQRPKHNTTVHSTKTSTTQDKLGTQSRNHTLAHNRRAHALTHIHPRTITGRAPNMARMAWSDSCEGPCGRTTAFPEVLCRRRALARATLDTFRRSSCFLEAYTHTHMLNERRKRSR